MSISLNHNTITLGKYLVSPLFRRTHAGDYLASVSIRNGRGSASHDRVFRFAPLFANAETALRYAASEGRKLVPGHAA